MNTMNLLTIAFSYDIQVKTSPAFINSIFQISNWPGKLEPKYLVMAVDAKKLELVNGELEDITGPFHEQGNKANNAGLFPALRQIPEVEILSFSHNRIKEIKANTFR